MMGREQTAGQLYCREHGALNSGRLVNLLGVGLLGNYKISP